MAVNLFKYCEENEIFFDWVVEAGVHDGTDTLKFAELPYVMKVFGFEPDYEALMRAEILLNEFSDKVILIHKALSDREGISNLIFLDDIPGTGSTQIGEVNGKVTRLGIVTTKLDLEIDPMSNEGVMWLDVEGHAVKVLRGSVNTLAFIKAAQIECELRDMGGERKRNYSEVIKLMRNSGLHLVNAPIYPVPFCDLIFIRTESLFYKWKSYYFKFLLFMTHRIVFKILYKKY